MLNPMTHASPSRGGEAGGDRQGDALFIGLFALFCAGVIAVDIFSVLHDRAEAGAPVSWWEPAVWETSSGLVMVTLLPAVLWLVRRAPPRLSGPFGWIAVHLGAALAFSLVHVVAMGLLRSAAYVLLGAVYDPLGPLGDWPYELRKDLLVYAGTVACYPIWREVRARRAPPSDTLAAIEVRDGARRRFVPVADLLWVEAAGNYVQLRTARATILHRASLTAMERRLAADGFVRIHRSRLVSRAAIAEVDTKPSGDFAVRLTSGETLSGSRRFRAGVLSSAA